MHEGNSRVSFRMENTEPVAPRSPFDRTGCKSSTRSKVANGKLLPLADGRSATAKRFRDLVQDIAADLGGKALLSEGQRQLIRRAAMLSAECERQETLAARGEAEFDCELYGTMCDRLGRLFGRLGLERRAHDVTPSLDQYLAAAHPEREAAK
jgi:hypothetical protein